MSPSPDMQQQGRYRSSMQRPQPLAQGQIPQGGPPSFTGGTPSGMQPMGAGQQQQAAGGPASSDAMSGAAGMLGSMRGNMPAPWDAPSPTPPDHSPIQSGTGAMDEPPPVPWAPEHGGPVSGPSPDPQPVGVNNRMPAPWQPSQQPQGGQQNRPMYQSGPGAGQRSQMSAPQAPASPMSQRQNVQQAQNQNRRTQ